MNYFKKLLLIVGSLFLSLLFLETLTRIFFKETQLYQGWAISGDYYAPDSEYIYSIKPNLYDEEGKPISDKYGFRTNGTIKKYTDDRKVIVIVGDSFVWGHTELKDTYPSQLENILNLNIPDNKFQVLNAGFAGYGTDQEYKLITEKIIPEIKPDVIVWNIHVNDVYDNVRNPLFSLNDDTLTSLNVRRNPLYIQGKIVNILPEEMLQKFNSLKLFLSYIGQFNVVKKPLEEELAISYAKSKIMYENVFEQAEKNNIKLIFATSPINPIINNLANRESFERDINQIASLLPDSVTYIDQNSYILDFENKNNETCRERKILGKSEPIDIKKIFIDESGVFAEDGWHPNYLGNYLMAMSVFSILSENTENSCYSTNDIKHTNYLNI